MLCYAMLCYVTLCYVMLCYSMLCYVILSSRACRASKKCATGPLLSDAMCLMCIGIIDIMDIMDIMDIKDNKGQPRLRGHHKQQPSTAAFCGLKDASRDRALWRPRGRRARQRRKTTQWNRPKRNRPNLPKRNHANRPKRNRPNRPNHCCPTGPSCMQMHSNTNSAGGMEAFPSEHQVLCASCL